MLRIPGSFLCSLDPRLHGMREILLCQIYKLEYYTRQYRSLVTLVSNQRAQVLQKVNLGASIINQLALMLRWG